MVVRPKGYQKNRGGSSWANRGATTASLPARIKCARGEWKTRDQYSNKKLSDYSNLVAAGVATPENSGILCREHTSNQLTEMQCRTCYQVMSLNHFSKSTIRKKEYTCKDCVAYRTADLELNLPPPGAQLSTDEIAAAQRAYQDISSFEDVDDANTTQPANGTDNSNQSVGHDDADDDDGDDGGDGSDDDDWAYSDYDGEEDDSHANWGDYSAGSSFASDAGYSSDASEGTLRAGLGSSAYSGSRDSRSVSQLNEFSVPSRSHINSSGSWASGGRSTSGSTSYSSSKSTKTTSTNKTTTTTSTSNAEPVQSSYSKWAKKPRKIDLNVPDYMRNRLWTDENVTTPRAIDYESDDSI
ncbi:Stc1 domain containing protein [Naviculisporaceae sp. PSN 640]